VLPSPDSYTDSLVGFETASLTVDAYGDSRITGDIAAGQTLRLHDANGAGSLRAEFPGANLTNAGTLILESVAGANPIDLLFADGTFTNSGTVDVNAGTGGTRALNAQLTNTGTLNVHAPTTGGIASASTSNSGHIRITDAVTAGTLALLCDYQQSGAGTLTIAIGGMPRTGDPLAISGNAQFGGTLDIDMLSAACEPENFTWRAMLATRLNSTPSSVSIWAVAVSSSRATTAPR
jgi:hypothetical protein